MRTAVLSGQGQDADAAWLAWPAGHRHGRSDAGRWRCPPLAAAVRTGSGPIGWAVTLNWDVRPTGRSRGPPCPSPGQPLPRCPQEVLVGGGGVQTSVRRPHPAEAAGQLDCGRVRHAMARSSRCPPGVQGEARADERLRRGSLLCHSVGPTEECGGGWVSWYRHQLPPSALAGRPGLCSAAGSPRRG
jgi:hypothetical protein